MGGGSAGIDRTPHRRQHVGREPHQALHVLKVGVEVAACDHRPIKGMQQVCRHIDQFLLNGVWLGGSGHDFAAGKACAVQVMFVGHQPGQAFAIGEADRIIRIVEEAQAPVGGSLHVRGFGHHEHRQVIRDVFGQHGHVGSLLCGGAHQATRSIIWWCLT